MQTLCAYRDSLLFWAGYYYRLRDDETLNYRKLFNELMGSMRYVQDKYGEVFKVGEASNSHNELSEQLNFQSEIVHTI